MDFEKRVKTIIKWHGADERITAASICTAIGCGVGQSVRNAVNSLRTDGFPICADSKGYWWGTKQEVGRQIESMNGRIRGMRQAMSGLKRFNER